MWCRNTKPSTVNHCNWNPNFLIGKMISQGVELGLNFRLASDYWLRMSFLSTYTQALLEDDIISEEREVFRSQFSGLFEYVGFMGDSCGQDSLFRPWAIWSWIIHLNTPTLSLREKIGAFFKIDRKYVNDPIEVILRFMWVLTRVFETFIICFLSKNSRNSLALSRKGWY